MRKLSRRVWGHVPPPRAITMGYVVGYLIIAYLGTQGIWDPPASIRGLWSTPLSTAWGILLVTGGLVASFASLTGRWFIEKPALLFCAAGVLMYIYVLSFLHFTEEPDRDFWIFSMVLVLVLLYVRFIRIHKYSYEPHGTV